MSENLPDFDIIIFRVDNNDHVRLWNGQVVYRQGYVSPGIGSNIIDYWNEYNLDSIIAAYQSAKKQRLPQRVIKKVSEQQFLWYFTPCQQEDVRSVSGYILNIDFMYQTINAAEKKYEDAQMMQSALSSHQTRYQCYNILMCLQSIQETVPIIQKTRLNGILNQEGQVLTHNELCEELLQDASKASQCTTILLKRQQQFEDVISCQQNTMTLDIKTFDVVQLLTTLWKDNFPEAKKKDIKFCLQIESLTETALSSQIKQDEFRFKQVCTTIIDNAIEFTPTRGTVHLQLSLTQESVQVSITDSGIGIEQDILLSHQQRMHSGQLSFSQTKPGAGLGLSLAIAHHIADLMKGSLEIKTGYSDNSSDGESLEQSVSSFDFQIGTQIIFTVPYQHDTIEYFYGEDPEDFVPARRSSSTQRNAKKQSNKFNIERRDLLMVVDDDAVVLKWWTKFLEHQKIRVHTFSDGILATNFYEAHHTSVSLIIMDIQMPHDGITATKQIRRFEEKLDLPFRVNIIANTASGASDALRRECQDAGMSEFMQKPNMKKEMKRIIDTYAKFI